MLLVESGHRTGRFTSPPEAICYAELSEKMPLPRVTVFIAAYDRERYVRQAVESVLCQTFPDLECLVIDDGSADRTAEIAASFGDPRVRVVRNDTNLGIPRTRNRGIDLAQDEYVAILDSDDAALPERIELQTAFLDANPGVAAVGCWARAMDAQGVAKKRLHTCPDSPAAIAYTLMFRCAPRQSTMMIRRAILEKYRYDERCIVSQDLELFGRLARDLPMRALQRDLVLFRHHPGRMTSRHHDVRAEIRRWIFGDRLGELGLDPSPTELDRHMLLAGPRDTLEREIDDEYLEWAASWLVDLMKRTEQVRGIADPAVIDVAASIWFQVLKCAHGRLGVRSVSRTLGWELSRPIRWKVLWRLLKTRRQ